MATSDGVWPGVAASAVRDLQPAAPVTMHAHRSLTVSSAALALTAFASAQISARPEHPLPRPQADIKTQAPAWEPRENAAHARAAAPAGTVFDHAVQLEHGVVPKGIDFSVVRYASDDVGALWARGADYKMSFDADGATLLPFFSSRAPRHFGIEFDLRSVTVGGIELQLATGARVERDGDTVTLDHGRVEEQYLLEPERIEQRFVIPSLPAAGPVVLQLDARTELAGASEDAGFRFSNEWGSVTYGAATAVDAAGRTLALESRLEAGRIEITVPAEFAASARLPLVIDPLIWIYGTDVSANLAHAPDSAYDLSNGAVMHCYEVEYNATDWDVAAYATDQFGNTWVGSFGWVDFTGAHWVRPRIAHNGATDRFLIAAQVGQPGARTIRGVVRSVFNTLIAGPVQMSGANAGDMLNVDVGGDPYGFLPSYFLVVYERILSSSDHDIHAQLIDTAGVINAGVGTIYIDNSGATVDEYPAVSKSNDASTWNVAWQRATTPTNHDIFGARVLWQGSVSAPTFPISTSALNEERPSVSSHLSGSARYVVATELDFSTDRDIMLYGLDGTTLSASANLSGIEGSWLFDDQRTPSIETDGGHFLVAYAELFSGIDWDIRTTEVQWFGLGFSVREFHIAVATTGGNETEPQVTSGENSNPNGASTDYTISYNRGPGPGSGTTPDVFAALFAGTVGGEKLRFCFAGSVTCPCGNGASNAGCPNSAFSQGATMAVAGNSKTTADTLSFSVSRMRPNSTSLLFQGSATINAGFGSTVGDGVRCVGGIIRRFPPHLNDATGSTVYPGPAELPLSWHAGLPLMGGTFYYQTWYRDSANFCSSGVTNMSDAFQVTWTP